MNLRILEELLIIDKNYFGSKENNDFEYLKDFIEVDSLKSNAVVEDLYVFSKKKFCDKKVNLKSFNILLELLEKNFTMLGINFNQFNSIKGEKDLSLLIICFFTLKFFTNHDPLKIKSEKNNEFIEDVSILIKSDADSIINHIISSLNKIIIWININYGNAYYINKIKIRLSLMWFLKELGEGRNCLDYEYAQYPKKGISFFINKPYDFRFNIELSHVPYKFYNDNQDNLYLYSYHYTTVNSVFKTNPKSNASITKSKSILIALNNILNNYIFICNSRLEIIIKDLCEEYLIDRKTVHENYKTLIENYSKFTKKNDILLTQEISIEISHYLRIINLENIKNNNNSNEKIFLPPMICFRGRTYFLSSASITFQKELRYCSHWGRYFELEPKYSHFLLNRVEEELEKRHFLLDKIEKLNFRSEKKSVKNAIIWILIAIAETKKGKQPIWTIDDFVNEGIKIINRWEDVRLEEGIEDRMKIDYHLNILKEINQGVYIMWLISKDATASVFQHCAKAMGVKDKKTLKWFNFDSKDSWYDTYTFVIDKWKEREWGDKEVCGIVEKYFTRVILKNTIMTHNYGARINSSFERFLKIIKERFKQELELLPKDEIFKKIFNDFFNFLENNPALLLYSSKIMRNELKKLVQDKITFCDGTAIFLQYNKIGIIQIEEQIKKKRVTKQQTVLLKSLDKKKIDSSIRANYVQGLDASLVRWFYSMNYKGITVHDCFMVDFMSVSFLISTVNQGMRIRFHSLRKEINFNEDEIFSIFILL